MIAAGLPLNGVTAVSHLGRNDNQITRIEGERLAAAGAAGLALEDSANGKLGMAVALIGLRALPGAAQLHAGLADKGLIDVAGMGHGGYRLEG